MSAAGDVVFRPRFGRVLTVGTGLLSVAALVSAAVSDPVAALRLLPGLKLVAVAVWAVFGMPAVVVNDGGVVIRNVWRTIELPWPSIQQIDTKYALTLVTAYGVFAAWAAPAPSRVQAMSAGRDALAHLPESRYAMGGVRPGDLLGTPSGDAASYVRRRWEELRDAGHLDDPRLEQARPSTRWHLATIVSTAALAALTIVALNV
ncbi:MAG: PH domain-containing protein [Cellulomonadaceae bacterium]|nr:PH domain-containing protein [Cellulomonadaceae bacterium]